MKNGDTSKLLGEYFATFNDDEIASLFDRIEHNYLDDTYFLLKSFEEEARGSLARSYMAGKIDKWLRSATCSIEFYYMLDCIQDAIRKECDKRPLDAKR